MGLRTQVKPDGDKKPKELTAKELAQQLRESIVNASATIDAFKAAGVSTRVLALLIADHSGMGITQINRVLESMTRLKTLYTK